MPIELKCAGCGQILRVADEHAGKKARCPNCGTITDVPWSSDIVSAVEDANREWAGPVDPAPDPNSYADRPAAEANPYASPIAPATGGAFAKAHRSGVVLMFGILGILCCLPFGIAAWVMGASDLSEMRSGRMDPSGESTTRVGMILGIVSVGFAVLWILLNIGLVAARHHL